MRLIAHIKEPKDHIKRLMIYSGKPDEAYLFGFSSESDGPSVFDYLQGSVSVAMEQALEEYGVLETDWKEIPDPQEGCQNDWIHPTRIKRNWRGKRQYGKFETLRDGKWIDVKLPTLD